METLSYRIALRLTKTLNVILITIPIIMCWNLYYAAKLYNMDRISSTGLLTIIFILLYMTYGRIYESFLVSLVRISEMIYSQCLAILMSDTLIFVVISLVMHHFVNILPMMVTFVSQLFVSVFWCICAHMWYFRNFPPKKTVIVYDRKQNVENLIHAYGLRKKFF